MFFNTDYQTEESIFLNYLRINRNKKIYFERLSGNNGDTLIVKGAEHVLMKAGCIIVEHPAMAELILINGGGAMNDIWGGASVHILEKYRRDYSTLPIIMAPSTYRFQHINFIRVCEINKSPLVLFARDKISEQILYNINLPDNVNIMVSQDLAFELHDNEFFINLLHKYHNNYVLIAMRKDREGSAGILTRTKGTWLPQQIRRPLSRLRDRLVAFKNQDVLGKIIQEERIPKNALKVFRDISVSVSFEEFVSTICNATIIITDRMHVGILGHMLNKQVILCSGVYHKIKGVFELSMLGPNSRTRLYQ